MSSEVRSVVVRLSAETSQYIAGVQAAAKATDAATRQMDGSVRRQSQALDTLGRNAGKAGLAAAAALGFAAKAAMDWESEWAGVAKTVDGTDQQLSALEDDLRGLARTMPATHQEIAATAEAAGQLGVATNDVADFTRVMVMMGETTNLTADDAATSIAQLMNVMETVPDQVDEIGNTIVDLGNKGASTESQITDMAQRLAGAGKLIGASEADVLGMASAMANLGIQSELGGGATQRVLTTIYTAVQDGGDALQGFADLAGMSAQEFAQAWSTDPVRAFDAVITGLNGVQESGGNVVSTLADLGIRGTQNLQVLLRLAGSGDMLTKSLDQANMAWEQNDALLIEYEKRAATTASQVQVAWNNIKDAGIDAGQSLLPVAADGAHALSSLASAYRAVPGPAKGAINGLLGTTAVLGLGIWGTTKAIGTVRDLRSALETLPVFADRSSRALKGLGYAAGGLVALGTVAGAIRAIQAATDETLPGVDSLALQLLQLKNGDISTLGTEFDSLGESIRRITDKTSEEAFGDALQTPFTGLVGEAGTLRRAKAEIDDIDQALASLVQTGGPEVAADALNAIGESADLSSYQVSVLTSLLPHYNDAVAAAATQDRLAADAAGDHRDAILHGADALQYFLDPADAAASSTANLGRQMAITTMDAQQFKAEFDELNGILSASSSMVAYERAIDALSESMKKDGTFNAGVEAGRVNIENLNAVASTAVDRAQALKEAGDDLGALRVLKRAIGDLEDFGSKSEGAKRRAQPLIDELKSTTRGLRINVNPKPALDAMGKVGHALDDLDGRHTRPEIDADGKPAKDEINSTERLLGELTGHQYVAKVTADTSTARAAISALSAALNNLADGVYAGVGGFAAGGPVKGPGNTAQLPRELIGGTQS